jgi:signal-transduction protein with cAMP-binding, CBS, and nucleotidyltransferase domain
MDRSRLNHFITQRLADIALETPVFVPGGASVRTALEEMRAGSRSCVLAGSESGVEGIFTERDVLTKCMGEGFDWEQPLATVITRDPRTIDSSATVADAIAVLQQHSYRTLPVTTGGKVVGLVRTGDLLTHIAEAFPEDVLNLPPRPHQVMEKQEGG